MDRPIAPANAPGWLWRGFADRVMGGRSDLVGPDLKINREALYR